MEFSSLNPYQSITPIVGDNPDDLVRQLKEIKTPIKILSIIPFGIKQVAYIMGDIRRNELKKNKKEK